MRAANLAGAGAGGPRSGTRESVSTTLGTAGTAPAGCSQDVGARGEPAAPTAEPGATQSPCGSRFENESFSCSERLGALNDQYAGMGTAWMSALMSELATPSELMPLAPIPSPPKPVSHSPRVRRRWRRALELWRVAEETRRCLCYLWDRSFPDDRDRCPTGRVVAKGGPQHFGQLRLLRLCKRVRDCRRATPTGGDLERLCKVSVDDYVRTESRQYVPFVGDRQAEPQPGSPSLYLLDHLPAELRSFYGYEEHMIRDDAEGSEELRSFNRRYDSILGERSEYIKYLNREGINELWTLYDAEEAKGTCSIAAVPKKSGLADRKILMICPFNWAARSVQEAVGEGLDYGLYAGGALSQAYAESGGVVASCLDESHAFSSVRVPRWMEKWQMGPRVRAGELPRSWTRGRWSDDAWLRPGYGRLAMGGSHAVLCLMVINRARIDYAGERVGREVELKVLNDTATRQEGVELKKGTVAVYLHVDDVICFGKDLAEVGAATTAVKEALEEIGFLVTAQELKPGETYVGLELAAGPARWIPAEEKLRLLDNALAEAQQVPWLSALMASSVAAHFTHFALLWRQALSVLSSVYVFIQRGSGRRPWASLVREFRVMRGLLPLLQCEIVSRVAPVVTATDASGPSAEATGCPTGAFCLAAGTPEVEEVMRLGRRLDIRTRHAAREEHKKIHHHLLHAVSRLAAGPRGEAVGRSVRETALAEDEKVVAEAVDFFGRMEAGQMRDRRYLVDPSWGVVARDATDGHVIRPTLHRSVVPHGWFSDAAGWELLLARRWGWAEHVTRGEGRAPLIMLRALIGAAFRLELQGSRLFVVGLTDNTGTASNWGRGRSSRWQLNRILQMRTALEGCYNVGSLLGWCDTHHMPADGGTRPDLYNRLRLDRPVWVRDRLMLEVSLFTMVTTAEMQPPGRKVIAWEVRGGSTHGFMDSKARGKLLATLSSGHVELVWWRVLGIAAGRGRRYGAQDVLGEGEGEGPSRSAANRDQCERFWDFVAQAMCVLFDRGGESVVEFPTGAGVWTRPDMLSALIYCHCHRSHYRCRAQAESITLSRTFYRTSSALDTRNLPYVAKDLATFDQIVARCVSADGSRAGTERCGA